MEDVCGYERYEEPYSYEVRDRRVRIARGLQAVDGLTTSAAFDEPAARYVEGEIGTAELREIVEAHYDQGVGRDVPKRFSAWSGTLSSAGDNRQFILAEPSTIRKYRYRYAAQDDGHGTTLDAPAETVRYRDGLAAKRPSQESYLSFTNDERTRGYRYTFEDWVDGAGNRYAENDALPQPAELIADLTSEWTRSDQEVDICTVTDYTGDAAGMVTYVEKGGSYTASVSASQAANLSGAVVMGESGAIIEKRFFGQDEESLTLDLAIQESCEIQPAYSTWSASLETKE